MEIKDALQQIPVLSTSTDREVKAREYILTPDEESDIIRREVGEMRKDYVLKHHSKLIDDSELIERAKKIDFESQIDKEKLFSWRNILKHRAIEQERFRLKRIHQATAEKQRLEQKCNAGYFYNLMKSESIRREGEFIENEDTSRLIKTVCLFMSRDKRFEYELGYSLKKGLLLRGSYGLGKTYLFELIRNNEIRPVSIHSMIEIASNVRESGDFQPKVSPGGILYLDDVGTEESTVNHYGNKRNWFREYFETFYLRSKAFNRLVISTNLSFDEMEDMYGGRFRSRVKQVFNIVDVTGTDLRK